MLHNVKQLEGMALAAKDGEIGAVKELYFDDVRWGARWLVVDTGGWLAGRSVLISPHSIRGVDWSERLIRVDLSREQVEQSPDIETDKPVARQQELAYLNHYGYPGYWGGPFLWGLGAFPLPRMPMIGQVQDPLVDEMQALVEEESEGADDHLRSSADITGYAIHATDGDIGHVEDFLFDDEDWALRFMIVATRNWWPGKKVLIAPQWARHIDWMEREVAVDLTREQIKSSPEYDATRPLAREYEAQLFGHYGRPGYWTEARRP